MRIANQEYKKRCDDLQEKIEANQLSGVVLFDSYYILYYIGFAFIPTERPIAFLLNSRGEKALLIPRLELEHARSNALVDKIEYYVEYPYESSPMRALLTLMADLDIKPPFGADHNGYPWILGYRGPSFSDLLGYSPLSTCAWIEDQMMIKSQAEIMLIRESVKWANLAHMLLQRYTKVGLTETEVSLRASMEATLAMLDAIGPIYRAQSPFSSGASAGYRGQIGRNASIPHALASNIVFQQNDVLVSGANAPVWGYNSELERTMVLGKANDKQREMFEHMYALQEIAIQAIKSGRACADVDREVRSYYEKNNLMEYWKHHSGHAIGLRYHEAPFLDIGDLTEIRPGMVFTVEPGLYIPGLGGFRHSDTILVTEGGNERLTYYPRDLPSLTI